MVCMCRLEAFNDNGLRPGYRNFLDGLVSLEVCKSIVSLGFRFMHWILLGVKAVNSRETGLFTHQLPTKQLQQEKLKTILPKTI